MSSKPFIVFPDNDVWRIAGAVGMPLTEIAGADAVPEALRGCGYRPGDAVLLALPSAWCLCASVAAGDLPSRGRRQALAYRLEEKLPVSAEDVVADFVPAAGDGNSDVLGVCVQTRQLRPLLEALDAAGVGVQSISPASLLALQHRMTTGGTTEAPLELLLWGDADAGTLELFVIAQGRPAAWYVLPDDANDLSMHLGVEAASRGFGKDGPAVSLVAGGAGPELLKALTLPPGVKVVPESSGFTTVETYAAIAGREVLAGRAEPWVELRRDALAGRRGVARVRTALTAAGIAAAVFVLALSVAMLWRAGRYDAAARENSDAQRNLFREVLPGREAPPDVRSRLAAEERGLRALRGGASGDRVGPAAPAPAAGLVALRDVIARLPRDVRYRVLEVRFDGPKFWLDGQARSHGDADAIAAALREGGLCSVEPPRTEQLDDGTAAVSFSIAGTVDAPAAQSESREKRGEGRS